MKMLKLLVGLGLLCMVGAGCRGHADEHTPPAGLGSIMVRNNTGDDIYVYIDGSLANPRADAANVTAYDLKPGSYRVALTESRGWRSWSGFVDVLEGRLTFLDVTPDLQNSVAYDVVTFFD
jgi:hypothetical protein